MRLLAVAALLPMALGCVRLPAQGNEEVVHAKPLHVLHFEGTVVDSRGMTVEYATVELRDPKTHRLLASTFADGKGHFAFDDKKYGKQIELRAIQKGFNIATYTAERKPFGDLHLRLVLAVAS